MAYENIIFQVDGGIATITFNRPKAMNALNAALMEELSRALDEIAANEDIRVLILTGAGEKAFVAGADITELATYNSLQAKCFAASGHATISKLQELPVAVIAAVNGFALGGGNEIAIACDFIYASENAMFGLPEITLGLMPGFGGTQRLPRLVGKGKAKELIFTGGRVNAREALDIGLVNKICEPQGLIDECKKMAAMICETGPIAIEQAKYAINHGYETDINTGLAIESNAYWVCIPTEDRLEGLAAFKEKRKPVFKGK